MRILRSVVFGFYCSVVFFACLARADYEDKDLIHITHTQNTLFAFSEKNGVTKFDLRLKEKILWKSAEGRLGAVLTDDRLLVITTDDSDWRKFTLYLKESESVRTYQSKSIILLTTRVRAIAFDIQSKEFIETPFSHKEEVKNVGINKTLAVVISSERAMVLSPGNLDFVIIRFELREIFENYELKKDFVLVNTNRRFLSYRLSMSQWEEMAREN